MKATAEASQSPSDGPDFPLPARRFVQIKKNPGTGPGLHPPLTDSRCADNGCRSGVGIESVPGLWGVCRTFSIDRAIKNPAWPRLLALIFDNLSLDLFSFSSS